MNLLSHQEARRVYDKIGSLQDTQAFYEDRATRRILENGDFGTARSVFEFGCGTGRFALRLFREHLTVAARYRGVDVSPVMVDLARSRLAGYASRAEVAITEGRAPSDEEAGVYDRFLSNYVFDLLSESDSVAIVREAHRMLEPDGLLCLAGLCEGFTVASRAVAAVVKRIHSIKPEIVGGCRPVDLVSLVPEADWEIEHNSKVSAFGVPSEVIIARRRPTA